MKKDPEDNVFCLVALISSNTPPQFYLTLATVVPWVDCAHLPSLALPLPQSDTLDEVPLIKILLKFDCNELKNT